MAMEERVMFTGLTWFGIPFEYCLRFSELITVVSIGISVYYWYQFKKYRQSKKEGR
jgi:hypothetical protein